MLIVMSIYCSTCICFTIHQERGSFYKHHLKTASYYLTVVPVNHDIILNEMESFRQKSEAAKLLFLLLKFITNGSGETIPQCKQ